MLLMCLMKDFEVLLTVDTWRKRKSKELLHLVYMEPTPQNSE